jgi:hypothetical protein
MGWVWWKITIARLDRKIETRRSPAIPRSVTTAPGSPTPERSRPSRIRAHHPRVRALHLDHLPADQELPARRSSLALGVHRRHTLRTRQGPLPTPRRPRRPARHRPTASLQPDARPALPDLQTGQTCDPAKAFPDERDTPTETTHAKHPAPLSTWRSAVLERRPPLRFPLQFTDGRNPPAVQLSPYPQLSAV